MPSVSFHLGLLTTVLGRFDDADVHFAVAAADHERIEAPTFLTRTRLEWARMLLNQGRPENRPRACTMLEAALVSARQLGLAGVERRAVELLAP